MPRATFASLVALRAEPRNRDASATCLEKREINSIDSRFELCAAASDRSRRGGAVTSQLRNASRLGHGEPGSELLCNSNQNARERARGPDLGWLSGPARRPLSIAVACGTRPPMLKTNTIARGFCTLRLSLLWGAPPPRLILVLWAPVTCAVRSRHNLDWS